MSVPQGFKPYFWDTQLDSLDLDTNRQYIIARLLKWGDRDAWKWLTSTYNQSDIIDVVKSNRELSSKDANFYANIYHIPQEELRCHNPGLTSKL